MLLTNKENSENNLKKALLMAKQKKEKGLFVFDLDSTLFCMKYRTQAIIQDGIKNETFHSQFPKQIEMIKKAQVTERDWSIPEILSRYGFSPQEPFVLAMNKFWRKHFFKNDYLHLDRPYKGCVNFIQNISQFKSKIFYLTARNKNSMFEGTVQSLKKWKFPFENEKQLIMKEDNKTTDADYKTKQLQKLSEKYETIVFFENEPVILNQVAKTIPEVHLFWLNSTHSRREEPPKTAFPLSMDYQF